MIPLLRAGSRWDQLWLQKQKAVSRARIGPERLLVARRERLDLEAMRHTDLSLKRGSYYDLQEHAQVVVLMDLLLKTVEAECATRPRLKASEAVRRGGQVSGRTRALRAAQDHAEIRQRVEEIHEAHAGWAWGLVCHHVKQALTAPGISMHASRKTIERACSGHFLDRESWGR